MIACTLSHSLSLTHTHTCTDIPSEQLASVRVWHLHRKGLIICSPSLLSSLSLSLCLFPSIYLLDCPSCLISLFYVFYPLLSSSSSSSFTALQCLIYTSWHIIKSLLVLITLQIAHTHTHTHQSFAVFLSGILHVWLQKGDLRNNFPTA